MVFDDQTSSGLTLVMRPPRVEAALWRRLRFENEFKCRQVLFNRHLDFARRVARREWRRWPAPGLERADFEQLAFGGLLEAIDRYDPMRHVPFEAFALPRLRGAISDGAQRASESGARHAYQRRVRSERLRALSKDRTPHADPIAELAELAALLAIGLIAEGAAAPHSARTGYETNAWRDLEQSLLAELGRLGDSERLVVEQHYLHGLPFAEIAGLMALSPGRVSQLHRAALTRLRERLKRSE